MLLTMRRDHRLILIKNGNLPAAQWMVLRVCWPALSGEIKEETGYTIEPLEQLSGIYGGTHNEKKANYLVFMVVYICKIKSGRFQTADAETRDHGWFTIQQALKRFIASNKKCLEII